MDDASIDQSQAIALKFQKTDSRIRIYTHSVNQGAAKARNLGTLNADGAYIAFLDADDLWYPRKLEKQLIHLKNYDVCFSSYDLMDNKGAALGKVVTAIKNLSLSKLLRANYIGNLTGVYNASSLGKIYVKDLKKRQDWLLWINALKRSSKPAYGIEESLAIYRVANNSLSSNKLNLIKYNFLVYREGLEYSWVKSITYFLRFVIEQLFVKPTHLNSKV